MDWHKRLKRWVASGLRRSGGGQRSSPDTESRPNERPKASSTTGELVSLAWPIATAMLSETALGLVDTKLVGGLGPAALAGVGMGFVLLMLCQAAVFGMMRGVKVRAAYAIGEGRPEDALRYGQAGALIGAGIGLAVALITQHLSGVLGYLGVNDETIPYAHAYLSARGLGAMGSAVMSAMVQYRQGIGDSRTPMITGIAGNVVNAGLAWALIYGRLGLPALGVRGAGLATAIVEVLQCAVLLGMLLRDKKRPSLSLRKATNEVLDLGLPLALHFGMETAAFTTFTALLGGVKPQELAASQIGFAVIRASFLPGVALAEATSVLVARSLGQKRPEEADRVVKRALLLGMGFMTACGVVFAVAGGAIAGVFTNDHEVVAVAKKLLLVAAVFQTLDAVNMVLRGALRGAKDVRFVAVAGTCIVWFAVPGSAFVLGRVLGLGALGGWLGFILETSLAAALFYARWRHGAALRAAATGGPEGAPRAASLAPSEPEIEAAPLSA